MTSMRRSGMLLTVMLGMGLVAAGGAQGTADKAQQPAAKTAAPKVKRPAPVKVPAPDPPDMRADGADQAWLALVDAGQYRESWKATAAAFQAAVPQEKWEEALGNVRTPLGRMTSRKLEDAKFSTSLPGAPDGEYIVAMYATSFANKAEAHETVTASHEKDGSWRVSGYFIN